MAYMCVKYGSRECTGCGGCQESNIVVCENCGDEIKGEIYTDEDYDVLCEDCLLELHRA
jgi:hypothetical protein